MTIPRRQFLGSAVAVGTIPRLLGLEDPGLQESRMPTLNRDRFDPWVEVDPEAIRHNVLEVTRLSAGRPILAVVKNNAYGLDLGLTAQLLEALPQVAGFAVVKPEAALQLREAGIRKPILLMGMATDEESEELARLDVQLSLYTEEAGERIESLAGRLGRPVPVHFYLDTGMGRMGMSFRRALPWMEAIAATAAARVQGTFTALTEVADFDREQLDRFDRVVGEASRLGIPVGQLHAAASNAVFHLPAARLDLVRPGIALYGSYPSRPEEERAKAELRPAVSLKCRVVRVERLQAGDGVSYGRNYVARGPTWVATLPVGHADGYPRSAVLGARVLIGGSLYPVIGAVSASHTIVEVGAEPTVEVGDLATAVGPDPAEIRPNAVAAAARVSVYDVLMHLNPTLPRVLQGPGGTSLGPDSACSASGG